MASELPCRANCLDAVADDRAHNDEVASGRFELAHGRNKVRVGWSIGGFCRQFELQGGRLVLDRVTDLVTKVGVLVHRANLLPAFLLRQVLYRGAYLVVVGGELRK